MLLVTFMTICVLVTRGLEQYLIKDGDVPSYLYHNFNDIQENIFPHDIMINISLTRISGILFYSIDRNMNQLIITLSNHLSPLLDIEFRNQKYSVYISQLCGCERCRYEILTFRILMGESILLKCNNGEDKKIQFKETIEINKNYPMPYTNVNSSESTNARVNEAQMWLVNRPPYKDVYPNMHQLSGCIFGVSYNSQPINFDNISNNIGRKCMPACKPEICNGGECLETYESSPVCNCTLMFLNGPYCNNSQKTMNIRSLSQIFQFAMFKVSWRSSAREILRLENEYVHIRLLRIKRHLFMEYNFTNGDKTILKETITDRYVPNQESICIVSFYETFVFIKFLSGGNVSSSKIVPIKRNLQKEIFKSLTLRSGNGSIDIVSKTSMNNVKWTPITLRNTMITTDEESLPMNSETFVGQDPRHAGNVAAIVFLIMAAAAYPLILFIYAMNHCLTKSKDEKRNKDILEKIANVKKQIIENMDRMTELWNKYNEKGKKKCLRDALDLTHKIINDNKRLAKELSKFKDTDDTNANLENNAVNENV